MSFPGETFRNEYKKAFIQSLRVVYTTPSSVHRLEDAFMGCLINTIFPTFFNLIDIYFLSRLWS